jgi:hypothetical protein
MGRFSINFTYLCLSNPACIINVKIDWPLLNPQGQSDETKILIWERMKATPRLCLIRNVLGITECAWNVPRKCSECVRNVKINAKMNAVKQMISFTSSHLSLGKGRLIGRSVTKTMSGIEC